MEPACLDASRDLAHGAMFLVHALPLGRTPLAAAAARIPAVAGRLAAGVAPRRRRRCHEVLQLWCVGGALSGVGRRAERLHPHLRCLTSVVGVVCQQDDLHRGRGGGGIQPMYGMS